MDIPTRDLALHGEGARQYIDLDCEAFAGMDEGKHRRCLAMREEGALLFISTRRKAN